MAKQPGTKQVNSARSACLYIQIHTDQGGDIANNQAPKMLDSSTKSSYSKPLFSDKFSDPNQDF
jgi:hypothetical protein